jgi:ketosteroid isomerase-like protein
MSGELSLAAAELLASFDSFDFDAVMGQTAEDAQVVDDLSRHWVRGKTAIGAHMQRVASSVDALRTELTDVAEAIWGEVGVLTCQLEQTYTSEGQKGRSGGPATVVFHREAGEWKLALFHVVALPEEA